MPAWFSRLCPQMLAVFILTALPAAALLFVLQKPVFEACASILVRPETKTDMKTAQALLHGSRMAEQVLADVGGDRLFPETAADVKVRLLRRQLHIEPGGSSRMFNLLFRHQDEQLAAETVKSLLRLFEAELEKLESAALEQELVLSRKRLLQAENTLAMFERNSPPPVSGAQEDAPPEARRESVELLLAGAAEKEHVLAGKLDELRRQFAAAAAGQTDGVQEDWTAFLDMKLYERELRRKYKEDDPLLISVRQQLEMQRERLRNHGGPAAETLSEQIAEAAEALGGQREERENMQRRLSQLAAPVKQESRPALRLRDGVEKAQVLLAQQMNRLAARQQERLITVIEQPAPPLQSVRPKQLLSILAAACFGLLCSLLHALLQRKKRGPL